MKRFFRILLTLLVLAALTMPVRAAGKGTLRAVNAAAQPGQIVRVSIVMENNPGLICLGLRVEYDTSRLTLTDVTDGGILGKTNFPSDKSRMPYQLNWENDTAQSDFTNDGVLATLVFRVAPDAPAGDTQVKLTFLSDLSLNYNLKAVSFKTENALVSISGEFTGETPEPETPTDEAGTADPNGGEPGVTDEAGTADPADTAAPSATAKPGDPTSPTAPGTGNGDPVNPLVWIIPLVVVALGAAVTAVILITRKKK